MRRRLTVAELFAHARRTAIQEEERTMAMEIEGRLRAAAEARAREEQLGRMRMHSQSLLAGNLAERGVPGAAMMLAQQGISPHVLQMAAAMSNPGPALGDYLPGLGG